MRGQATAVTAKGCMHAASGSVLTGPIGQMLPTNLVISLTVGTGREGSRLTNRLSVVFRHRLQQQQN